MVRNGGFSLGHGGLGDLGAVLPSFGQGIPGGAAFRVFGIARRDSAFISVSTKLLYMVHDALPPHITLPARIINQRSAKSVPRLKERKCKAGPVPTLAP
jgi:hypothetical protein